MRLLDTVQYERLLQQLLLHEGLRLKPYHDTEGKWTVGIGYNISDRGLRDLEASTGRALDMVFGFELTEHEAFYQLGNDIGGVEIDLALYYPWMKKELSPIRLRVFLDMVYNLGIRRFDGFANMLYAAKQNDPTRVSIEMLNSKWARQVKTRAARLAQMYLTDKDYTS